MSSTQDFDARARTWDDDPMKTARAQAVADAITDYGTCFGLPYELEIEAARAASPAST